MNDEKLKRHSRKIMMMNHISRRDRKTKNGFIDESRWPNCSVPAFRRLLQWIPISIIWLVCILVLTNVALAQNDEKPKLVYEWERVYYGKLNNERKLLFAGTFARIQMSFADIDNDGDEDLFVGKADGRIAYFENLGRKGDPNFELKTESFEAIHLESNQEGELSPTDRAIDVRANAAPTFTDIDGDGDLDLFIGSKDGNIFYYQNVGNALLPQFRLEDPTYMKLRPGSNSIPRFIDVNTDRAPDLLVGNHAGKVYLYQNAGQRSQALFCNNLQSASRNQPPCRYPRIVIGDISPEVDASPALGDWNYDGLLDLLIGKANGEINFYYNRGTSFQPKWELESDHFLFIDAGGFASPVFHDLNSDGFLELLIGSSTFNVVHYENREVLQKGLNKIDELDLSNIDWKQNHLTILELVCEQLQGPPLCLAPLARAFNIPNTVNQSLNEYGNFIVNPKVDDNIISETQEPGDFLTMANRNKLWLVSRNFLNFGKFLNNDQRASITSGDWDNDGDLDLIIGSELGQLYAFENIGTMRNPNWRQVNFPVFEANQRSFSTPTLKDIDGDEDMDLIVGNRNGKLELILNEGDKDNPKWKIDNLNFGNIDVGFYSSPTFFDIDGDEDFDLFVGNSRGLIIYYENNGSKTEPQFSLKSTQFANVVNERFITPAFFPWNEDNAFDLVTGNREGLLHIISNNHLEGAPFTHGWRLEENEWNDISTNGFSSPHFMDWDQDQKLDLLLGDKSGNIIIYLNRGFKKAEEIKEKPVLAQNALGQDEGEGEEDIPSSTDAPPQIVEQDETDLPYDPEYILVTKQYLNVGESRRIVPAFIDMDADGDLDLIYGTRGGLLVHYLNEGDPKSPKWTFVTNRFLDYKGGRNAAPVFGDIDNDGDIDLLIGTSNGKLAFWENQGSADFPEFTLNPTRFQGITGGPNSRPTLIDTNQDGLTDLLIGNFRGSLVHYLQKPTATGSSFTLLQRNYLGLRFGLGSSPTVADLNKDGRLELIVGSDQGGLFAFQNDPEAEGSPDQLNLKLDNRFFEKMEIKPPLGSFPVFVDIDNDKDIDMFIGGDDGSIYYYRNDGSPFTQK